MELKPLQIGGLLAKVPVIQGGMGVGISLSGLAGAVAAQGGIGIISTAQIGFAYDTFDKDPIVSGFKSAQVICRYWLKKYCRLPDLVVMEGPKAGGHLGFSKEQLETLTDAEYDEEIRRTLSMRLNWEPQESRWRPVL